MQKFAEVKSFPIVFQNYDYENPHLLNSADEPVSLKGRWAASFFSNEQPITLELACGKGDYTIGLAELYPDRNYIGIDVKGNRIWTGAKYAIENQVRNVAFVRTRIEYLDHFFAKNEIDEIWITFPDPFPRKGDRKKRLTSDRFLSLYRSICKPGARIHLKTDNLPLFHFSKASIEAFGGTIEAYQEDIYSNPIEDQALKIQTYYEKMHLEDERTINYLNFRIP